MSYTTLSNISFYIPWTGNILSGSRNCLEKQAKKYRTIWLGSRLQMMKGNKMTNKQQLRLYNEKRPENYKMEILTADSVVKEIKKSIISRHIRTRVIING